MQMHQFTDRFGSKAETSIRTKNAEKEHEGIRWMSCGTLSLNDVMQKTQLIKGGKMLFS